VKGSWNGFRPAGGWRRAAGYAPPILAMPHVTGEAGNMVAIR
jgi:hypothetical protein